MVFIFMCSFYINMIFLLFSAMYKEFFLFLFAGG